MKRLMIVSVVVIAVFSVIISVYLNVKYNSEVDKVIMILEKSGELSSKDKVKLKNLGKTGEDALLIVFQKRALVYDKNPHVDGTAPTSAQSKASDDFLQTAQLMEALMPKYQTAKMLDMLPEIKDSWVKTWIIRIVAGRGDTKLSEPVFFKILQSKNADLLTDEACEIVYSSGDPRVTDFLVKAITNPKVDSNTRQNAYINAARFGNQKAINAILSVRNTDRTIPSIAQAMQLDKLCTHVYQGKRINCSHPVCNPSMTLVAKKTDKNGVLWGLITSPVIGGKDDLWIVYHDGKHWTSPVFTGINLDQLGTSDWFRIYVNNKAILKDSDNDGWTDLIEKRLHTNPINSDSDSDGLKDSQDMNPLAAPRKLNDNEKILAAVLEAANIFTGNPDRPCIFTYPKEIKPFEILGWDWITVPENQENEYLIINKDMMFYDRMSSYANVSIGFPSENPHNKELENLPPNSSILFNKDYTKAGVGYSISYGPRAGLGYDFELKKINGEWFVVKRKFTWIS